MVLEQVLLALTGGFAKEVWAHKLLALLALFTGWAVKDAWIAVIHNPLSAPSLHKAETDFGIWLL